MSQDSKNFSRREFCQLGLRLGAGLAALSTLGRFPIASAAELNQEELCYLPASLQLELFRRGMLSPVDVLKAQIARIERYESKVNSITYTHFDEARQAARESEQRWRNGSARALEGITVGVKDEHGKAGWIVTEASKTKANNRLDEDDPLAQRLLEAGAILHIQTTVPEFYLHFCTWSDLWGVTRNPWNLAYCTGASSGGSGVALAAGFCTIATGSDMGGSIRLPCSWNGLYGFKPPFGRIPTPLPLAPYSGSGPMARTFEDMVRMQNVIAHPHASSVTTLPHQELPLRYPSVKGMRIAYSPDEGWADVDPEVVKATNDSVQILRDLGATVDEVDFKLDITAGDISTAFAELALSGPLGAILATFEDRADELTTYARKFVKKAASGEYGAQAALSYQNNAIAGHEAFTNQIWSKGYEAFITPTVATPHLAADYDYTRDKPVINGKKVHPLSGPILTPLFNLLNWYPVVNVPTALSSKNVPMGMQIVTNSYQDRTAMQIAGGYALAAPRFFTGDLIPDFRES